MSYRFTSGSLRGEVLPSWRPVVVGPEGLRLEHWLKAGQAQLIKHGPRRAVYRVDAQPRKFFVKQYRCLHWWEALGNWLRGSQARREFLRGTTALNFQIPTAEPIAWFESHRAGIARDSFIVTRALEDTVALDQFVELVLPRMHAVAQPAMRRNLAFGLAKLCAAAHRAGLDHNDLHAGNVLVRAAHGDAMTAAANLPELFLIDLPGVRLFRSLSRRRGVASLAMLGAACSDLAAKRDMCRFLRHYATAMPEMAPHGWRELARRVAQAMPARRRRVARGRDKRALRSNRDFRLRAGTGSKAIAVRDLDEKELQRLIESPHELLQANSHRPYKLSHRSMVVQAELPLGGRQTLVAYKRVRPRNWWKTLLHFIFRRNPALDAWRYGHSLSLRGIATARPLAVIHRKRWGAPAEAYLATQWIAGAMNLHVYGWELSERAPRERHRRTRQVCESLGRLLGRMHAWHISHRDLKGCNILIVERDDGVDCFLIDADSVHVPRSLSRLFRTFNLARLATSIEAHGWVTRSDRLRFLRAYLRELHGGDPGAWPADSKQAWRAVAKATRTIVHRLRRRGREVV